MYTFWTSCKSVALRNFLLLTDQRSTVPPIVKTEYLFRRKNCSLFRLNFVKTSDEKNTRNVYLLGKNIYKPLVHLYKPLSAWNSQRLGFPLDIYITKIGRFHISEFLSTTGKFRRLWSYLFIFIALLKFAVF